MVSAISPNRARDFQMIPTFTPGRISARSGYSLSRHHRRSTCKATSSAGDPAFSVAGGTTGKKDARGRNRLHSGKFAQKKPGLTSVPTSDLGFSGDRSLRNANLDCRSSGSEKLANILRLASPTAIVHAERLRATRLGDRIEA